MSGEAETGRGLAEDPPMTWKQLVTAPLRPIVRPILHRLESPDPEPPVGGRGGADPDAG